MLPFLLRSPAAETSSTARIFHMNEQSLDELELSLDFSAGPECLATLCRNGNRWRTGFYLRVDCVRSCSQASIESCCRGYCLVAGEAGLLRPHYNASSRDFTNRRRRLDAGRCSSDSLADTSDGNRHISAAISGAA